MKLSTFLACLILIAGVSPLLADDEQTLRHFKTVLWPQAYRTQDTTLLDQMLDDRFQMIDDAGNVSTKESELKWVSENAWNPSNFRYEIERLEIFNGDMAIISGTGVTDTYRYKSSNVLIKTNGLWRAVSSHVSGYEKF